MPAFPADARTLLIFDDEPEPYAAVIRQRFPELAIATCTDFRGLGPAIAKARPDFVICTNFGDPPFPRDALIGAPGVRWVQNGGAGIDHLTPWDPAKITVTNASGIHADSLAEYVVCGILMLSLGFLVFNQQQRRHEWAKRVLPSVVGKTLTVVGFGKIGRAAGKRARALGMEVIGVRANPVPSPEADRVIGIDGLKDALGRSDYVALTIPRTPKTVGLMNGSMLDAIKPGAGLVNISRGRIVDEDALIARLKSGRIAGAVIDVFATEPLATASPFWDLPNVFLTPHTGDPEGWKRMVAELFCENLGRARRSEPMVNVVLPERGY